MEASEVKTRYDLDFQARYFQRTSEVHGKFFCRINSVLTFIILFCGSASFASIFSDSAALKLSGLMVCAFTIILFIVNPARRQILFENQTAEISKVIAAGIGMPDNEFDKLLQSADEKAVRGEIDSLRLIAQNDVMIEKGHEPYPVTWRENLLGFFV